MATFSLLWGKILDSSVWQLSKESRLVWITMLAMKDKEGFVSAAIPGLAHRARVTLEECEIALAELAAPDPYSGTPDEDGRRILNVPGGWRVVNHELYRMSDEMRRESARVRKANERSREKMLKGTPLPGESAYVKAEAVGASDEQLARMSEPIGGRLAFRHAPA